MGILTDTELNTISLNVWGYGIGNLHIKKITTATPKGFKLNSSGNYTNEKRITNAEGLTFRRGLATIHIHISPSATKNRFVLEGTLGHELIHAYHMHRFGLLYIRKFSEHIAYTFTKNYFADIKNKSTHYKDEYDSAVESLKTRYSSKFGLYRMPKGFNKKNR